MLSVTKMALRYRILKELLVMRVGKRIRAEDGMARAVRLTVIFPSKCLAIFQRAIPLGFYRDRKYHHGTL